MYSNSLAHKIAVPTRFTTHSKIVIDIIFDTNTGENSIARTDHMSQFLVYTNKSHRTTAISKQVCSKR